MTKHEQEASRRVALNKFITKAYKLFLDEMSGQEMLTLGLEMTYDITTLLILRGVEVKKKTRGGTR